MAVAIDSGGRLDVWTTKIAKRREKFTKSAAVTAREFS